MSESFVERLNRLRNTREFRNYEKVREHVLAILDGSATGASDYWLEELANMEYLLDASPLIVEKLRHHCFHVTGVRPYDYRSGDQSLRRQLSRRLDELGRVGGQDIRVPEASTLGGFGYTFNGGLYNLDTLKYYECLVAMRMGGVLDALMEADSPVILEVGGGWGGMAYQVKTLIPDATYVIVDLPELFLLSATYLATAFPSSTQAFYEEDMPWPTADFVFVTSTQFPTMKPPQVDLALNTVSFQEMTTQQVTEYINGLSNIGTQAIYSLNRPRSVYNNNLTSVHSILNEHFELVWIKPLSVAYNEIYRNPNDRRETLARVLGKRANEYRHHVGRPRP